MHLVLIMTKLSLIGGDINDPGEIHFPSPAKDGVFYQNRNAKMLIADFI